MTRNHSVAENRHKHFVAGLFANALWGFMAFPLRSMSSWSSDTVLYFRILVSLFFIWLFIFCFRYAKFKKGWNRVRGLPQKENKRFWVLMLFSSALIMLNWFTFIYAINRVSITSAAFAYLVCPLITTLAGYFILKEKLTNIKWISLSIAFVSVVLLSQNSLIEVLWSITIASFYAFYLIIQRMLQEVDKLNFLAVQLAICSIVVIPIMLLSKSGFPATSSFWISIAILSVVFTLIPLFLSMFALNKISSSTMGILIYSNPIIAFMVAVFYFGEVIHPLQMVAYLLLIFAIVLYNSDILKQIISKFAKREQV